MTGVDRGIALSGALPLPRLAALAARAEALGYVSIWLTVLHEVTDVPAVLWAVSRATTAVALGLGLVPLAAFDAKTIADAVLNSAPDRTTVAIGAGTAREGSATRVTSAIRQLKELAPHVPVGVGGYGEALLRTAGRCADAVLLNWSTPAYAEWALRTAMSNRPVDRGRSAPTLYVYVPTAIGARARFILDAQLDVMAAQPHHRLHQERWGRSGMGIAAENGVAAEEGLRMFAPHHPVVLPVASGDAEIEWIMTKLRPAP